MLTRLRTFHVGPLLGSTARGWRAAVFSQGIRKSKVFSATREVQDWATRTEFEIQHANKVADKTLLGVVFHRYARDVSPQKKGGVGK